MARVEGVFPEAPAAASGAGAGAAPSASAASLKPGLSWCIEGQEGEGAAAGTASAAAAGAGEEAGAGAKGCILLKVDVPLTYDPKLNHVEAVPPSTMPASNGAAAPSAPGAAAGEEQQGEGEEEGPGGAKPAVTLFRRLWVAPDGKTSLVECRPKTGRTHQIRVHLQASAWMLAHPMAMIALWQWWP